MELIYIVSIATRLLKPADSCKSTQAGDTGDMRWGLVAIIILG